MTSQHATPVLPDSKRPPEATKLPDPTILLQEVLRLAEAFPHWQASCQYASAGRVEDKPHCIVGTALYNLGVPVTDLRKFDLLPQANIARVYELYEADGWDTGKGWRAPARSTRAISTLRRIQRAQDFGNEWQHAVRGVK